MKETWVPMACTKLSGPGIGRPFDFLFGAAQDIGSAMLTPPVEKDRTDNLRVQEEGFLREVLIDSFLFCMFYFG